MSEYCKVSSYLAGRISPLNGEMNCLSNSVFLYSSTKYSSLQIGQGLPVDILSLLCNQKSWKDSHKINNSILTTYYASFPGSWGSKLPFEISLVFDPDGFSSISSSIACQNQFCSSARGMESSNNTFLPLLFIYFMLVSTGMILVRSLEASFSSITGSAFGSTSDGTSSASFE